MATIYSWVKPNEPVITHIERESIMGNSENKTYHYYLGYDIVSYMDSLYRINYRFMGNDYSILCDNSTYNDAIKYIKNINKKVDTEVFKVFDTYYNDITYDFTCFAGPLGDFYGDTGFQSKCSFFSDTDIFVIDKYFNVKKHYVHSYINSDIHLRRMST